MHNSFKVGGKKQVGKQAMALRVHQQQSQNVSIRDVVEGNESLAGGGSAAKQLQLQLIPQGTLPQGQSQDGSGTNSFKVPHRPETSTGSKSKQMILMQYSNTTGKASNTINTKKLQ